MTMSNPGPKTSAPHADPGDDKAAIAAFDALVLAGGINRIRLYNEYKPGYKALLSFAGKPSVQYVLDALLQNPGLRRGAIVGPPSLSLDEFGLDPAAWELLPAGETVMESLFTGIEYFRQSPAVLCTTADLPLLTPAAVTDFLASCAAHPGADIHFAMVPEEAFTGPFAAMGKGFNRFRDRNVCHGNLFLLAPDQLFSSRLDSCLDRLYAARKSTLRAALVLGPKVGLAYLVGVQLLRCLSLERMAAIVSRRLGLTLVPILTDHPEVALDIDEPWDYRLVSELLED